MFRRQYNREFLRFIYRNVAKRQQPQSHLHPLESVKFFGLHPRNKVSIDVWMMLNNILRHFFSSLLALSIINKKSGLNIVSQLLQLIGLVIFENAVQYSVALDKHALDDLKQVLNEV